MFSFNYYLLNISLPNSRKLEDGDIINVDISVSRHSQFPSREFVLMARK